MKSGFCIWLGSEHLLMPISKIEVPRDVRNSKGPYTWQVQEIMVSTLEQMHVQNGTGPWVGRSKRPLLASRIRCNVIWKPLNIGNKLKNGNKVQIGNKFANCSNVWSIEVVIVYGHAPDCHTTFGKGRLHNVWWNPHIDHNTSWETISNVPWHISVRVA